jgi:uncharacterized protein YjiS (DUF1127 family)
MFHSRQIVQPDIQAPSRSTWASLRRLISWPFRVAAARATMRELAGLSDRELADIRLTRQDLRDASALPLDADPSGVFEMRTRERGWR